MDELILYYGVNLPARDRTRELCDTTVVLQPYHPLCQSGAFTDYFPHARRFVYWNPTGVSPCALPEDGPRLPILGYDDTWGLYRLDLSKTVARRFVADSGRHALNTPGVHGVFIDDLDRWTHESGRRHGRAVIRALTEGRRQIDLFVNRGFAFWARLPNLWAVLVEDLTPHAIDRMSPQETTWINRMVLPALRRARIAGIAAHSITYDPTAIGWQPSSATAAEFSRLVSEPLLGRIHLDHWPDALSERN
jgi:hypothetical protein